MAKENKENIESTTVTEKKFTKESILNSKKYKNRKPILTVLLKEGSTYSIKEVDVIVDKYMKSEVK